MVGRDRRLASLEERQAVRVPEWDHVIVTAPDNETREQAIAQHEAQRGLKVQNSDRIFWIELVDGAPADKEAMSCEH
jgi:hypothetical protein